MNFIEILSGLPFSNLGSIADMNPRMEFQRDEHNVSKIHKYQHRKLSIEEVESVFKDSNKKIEPDRIDLITGELRFICIGYSSSFRLLCIPFVTRENQIRPITGYPVIRGKLFKLYHEID